MHKIKGIPLPRFTDVIALFKTIPYNLFDPWKTADTQNVFHFSYARWALFEGVKAFLKDEKSTVWFPAYICKEAVTLFAKSQILIRYYPVNKNFSPDWEWLYNSSDLKSGDSFVIVHYFGLSNDIITASELCTDRGLNLIEDAAHVIKPNTNIGQRGKAVIYSLRKLFPIPDGGILVYNDIDSDQVQNTAKNSIAAYKWMVKRLLQRLIGPVLSKKKVESGESDDSPSNLMMSIASGKLLARLSPHIDDISNQRKNNYRQYYNYFKVNIPDAELFELKNEDDTPFIFPVIIPGKNNELVDYLRKHEIPVGRWPDLPEVILLDDTVISETAKYLNTNLIVFPVHQDVDAKAVDMILVKITEYFKGRPTQQF